MGGHVANNYKSRETIWRHWFGYFLIFKIDLHLQEKKVSWDWMHFLVTGFAAGVSSGNCGFGRDAKVLTVCKVVTNINETISMASNIVTGSLKLSKKNVLYH